jgi:hypothetical protein
MLNLWLASKELMMKKTQSLTKVILVLSLVILIVSCGRGEFSEKPPIHLNPNMDSQEKYKAQSESNFFADGSSMRTLG